MNNYRLSQVTQKLTFQFKPSRKAWSQCELVCRELTEFYISKILSKLSEYFYAENVNKITAPLRLVKKEI